MAQNFYTKWQDAILADAGDYVSKEYRSFQTALVREISKYAAAVGAKVASNSKGHYDTSCSIPSASLSATASSFTSATLPVCHEWAAA